MNREQMTAPFAEEELRQFDKTWKDRQGHERSVTLTYIEDETVMDRLDAGYGYGNWQVQVDAVSDSVVKVRLGVRDRGEWAWFEDFGYPNREGGESLKEAVSDGIRRCGRYVGIARDLYRKSTYEPGGTLASRGKARPAPRDPEHPGLIGGMPPPRNPEFTRTPEGGLIGTAIAQGNHDFNVRQTPDGWVLPFRVKNGNSSFIVRAENDLAQALDLIKARVIDERVTVWGRWSDETTPAKGTKPEIHYRILHLERIATPDGILPAPAFDSPDEPPLEEPPDDLELVGEKPALGLVK